MKKPKTLADAMKMDKKADAKMTVSQIKADISADKKHLTSKIKNK